MCGVTRIVEEFEAGWLAGLAGGQAWLAGRLLRSAVVVFAPMKQYGHVPSIVV